MGDRSVHLRLSGASALAPARSVVVADRSSASADRAARDAVAREMREAAGLSPDDARRIVATRVVESLEGGRAAILRPEARRRVVSTAAAHGLRPFDANLVIAIVQESTRRGEPVFGAEGESRLRLVGGGTIERAERRRAVKRDVAVNLIAAAALGIGVAAVLVAWLLGR